jgi:hypothetical protein
MIDSTSLKAVCLDAFDDYIAKLTAAKHAAKVVLRKRQPVSAFCWFPA